MKLLDTTNSLYSPAEAEAKAAELQAGDPDWTYTVIHDPAGTGYSFINVYDEEGSLVSQV